MTAQANLSEPVAKPDHIPDDLVYDFDMFFDPAFLVDPHERILELHREAPPVFWTPRHGGHWMIVGFKANFEAARDTETFSSEVIPFEDMEKILTEMSEDMGYIPRAYPINLDPPLHGKYRQPIQGVFSPRSINQLKESVQELAAELIAEVAPDGRCEFMSAVAEPLPVKVFLKMLGLPLEKMAEYRALVKEHLSESNADAGNALQRMQKVAEIMRPTVLERKEQPQDDIISLLWGLEMDGKPLTQEDLENYGVLLFIAGLDTVMNGMGHGVRHFARDQALQERVRADLDLVPEATEEMLRRYSFTVPPRRVAEDVEFFGAPMKAGERAMLFLPGADLDANEFPEPEKFDLDREKKVHIAFNAGPHRCLGSHLARLELQVLYAELLKGLPPFRLDPDKPAKFNGGHVLGVEELHLVWDV